MSREVRRVAPNWKHPASKAIRLEDMPPDSRGAWWQMYETVTEGTPISPPMWSAEALARWLAETGASAFAGCTATFEQWLRMIHQGSCFSAVIKNGELKSGVEAVSDEDS